MSILVAEDGGEAAGAVLRAERVERVEEGVIRVDGSSGRGDKERGEYQDTPEGPSTGRKRWDPAWQRLGRCTVTLAALRDTSVPSCRRSCCLRPPT